MKPVYTAKHVEDLILAGQSPDSFPADAILTPSAKDFLKDLEKSGTSQGANGASPARPNTYEPPVLPDYEFIWTPGSDPSTPGEILDFFYSPEIHVLKERICDLGRRMWERDYTDGNGGNFTIRVGDNLVLCTPTLISKGFMKPEDMCLVDLDSKQLAGKRPRTSECMTHLAIMKRQPKCKAVCHAHPTHATAFAVAGVRPPLCMVPEADVFLGEIGMAPYDTPGTPEVARIVGETGVDHMCVLMLNHGVITWGSHVEDAYWRMENCEALCHTVSVAAQINRGKMLTMTGKQGQDLIDIRKSLGMDDHRDGLEECRVCDNEAFKPGVSL
jgi:L-fuculose-phosphate aldolase